MENHRQQSHQNHDVPNRNNDNVNCNSNLNNNSNEPMIMVTNSDLSETSYICNEIMEEPIYYEMGLDDYEECILYENNGISNFDENNIIEYDEEVALNVHTNVKTLNDNKLQQIHEEYKNKKYCKQTCLELLLLLKTSNVSDAV